MRICGFSSESFVDGPGIRAVIFVQGCDNACPHCHNPESWDPGGGEEHTVRDVIKMIKAAAPFVPNRGGTKAPRQRKVRGVTFSGGEPFLQAKELVQVAQAVKKLGLDITTYTGNTYEQLVQRQDEDITALLALTDYLIDGPYVHELRNIGLKFRGSANQRIIDMAATREAGAAVEYEEKSPSGGR